MTEITRDRLLVLRHALGLDERGHGREYRNYYCTAEGSRDYATCSALVEDGHMVRHGPSDMYGGPSSYCFVVTDAGRDLVREHQEPPPKLTRSQARYRRYLAADSELSFGEWLRSGGN